MHVPYELHTERLCIRCYRPSDAEALQQSIAESIDHLLPWMTWAAIEPEPIEEKIERIRKFRHNFDGDIDYTMAIFELNSDFLIGGTGLHKRVGPEAFEIGYWLHPDYLGRGYATETAAALTQAAFEMHKATRVEIHCDPRNTASAAIPKRLGFRYEGTLMRRILDSKRVARDTMIWSIFREGEPTLINRPLTKAFDFRGEPIDFS